MTAYKPIQLSKEALVRFYTRFRAWARDPRLVKDFGQEKPSQKREEFLTRASADGLAWHKAQMDCPHTEVTTVTIPNSVSRHCSRCLKSMSL